MRNFKITVDGNVYDVSVEEVGANVVTPVPVAAPAPVKAVPAPVKAASAAVKPAAVSKPAAGGVQIKAPMPGMVLDYKMESGADVKKGQTVLVLEAMKMENDICAPADGKISFVAAKGATVGTGDILAVIN